MTSPRVYRECVCGCGEECAEPREIVVRGAAHWQEDVGRCGRGQRAESSLLSVSMRCVRACFFTNIRRPGWRHLCSIRRRPPPCACGCLSGLIDRHMAVRPPSSMPRTPPPRPAPHSSHQAHLPSSSPRHQHRPGRPPVAAALPSKLDYALPPRRLPGLFVRLSRLDAHTHVRRRRRARADEARQAGVGRPSSSLGVRGDRLSPHGRALAAECNERGHAH